MTAAARDSAGARAARRRARRRRRAAAGVAAVLVVAAGAVWSTRGGGGRGEAAPAPTNRGSGSGPTTTTTTRVPSPELIEPPRSPEAAAAALIRVERGIRGDDRDPARLQVLGWEQQLVYRQLANHEDWVGPVLGALPDDVRRWVQGNLDASAALARLTPPQDSLPEWTILTPPPPETLRAYYAEAESATGIPWAYLAAIHFLETRMGRIRGDSSAGAQGPMQFIPSSWAAFGEGGDVYDNRDAILAAGRYLRAAGGPHDMDAAIFAYNHDRGYVIAVQSYARHMLEDPRAYDGYYHWQVWYRTVDGAVLLPEGYSPDGPVGARPLPPI